MLSIWKKLFSFSVGTGGVLHTTARAGIYYACKACIPVRLGVCVCVFASVLCETDKEKRERKRARLIITSAVTDSEFTRHSDNPCLHASAMFRKARGSFWVHIQHVSFHLVPTGDVTVDRSRGLGVTVWLELDRVTKNPPKCIRLGFFFN